MRACECRFDLARKQLGLGTSSERHKEDGLHHRAQVYVLSARTLGAPYALSPKSHDSAKPWEVASVAASGQGDWSHISVEAPLLQNALP